MTFAATIIHPDGGHSIVKLEEQDLLADIRGGNPVADINRRYAKDVDLSLGTPFEQMKASVGLIRPGAVNPFGMRQALLGDVMSGEAQANTQMQTSPFGTASRYFVNIAVISDVLAEVQKDRTTDAATFEAAIANNVAVDKNHFEQMVLSYNTLGGPEQARAARVAQNSAPPRMLVFSTSDRVRTIGAWNIGLTITDQALKSSTVDMVTMTMAQYLKVERDQRVYRYINELFLGGSDLVTTTVPTITTTSLDAASTGGVLTHKAWVKFLARNRKFGLMTHAFLTVDTYLKLEARIGRPGSNNYDPTLNRIDPQAVAANAAQIGFGNNVNYVLVDDAADGGPVPEGEIWCLAQSSAVTRVTNTSAAYQATVQDQLYRTSTLRIDWAEEVYRTYGDTELTPFRRLVIA
jgi:hypothetical protein